MRSCDLANFLRPINCHPTRFMHLSNQIIIFIILHVWSLRTLHFFMDNLSKKPLTIKFSHIMSSYFIFMRGFFKIPIIPFNSSGSFLFDWVGCFKPNRSKGRFGSVRVKSI